MITYHQFLHFPRAGTVPTGATLFALADGQPVGTLTLHFAGPGGSQVSELQVELAHRRQGIGRALLQQAAELGEQRGKATLHLLVPELNLSARHFCQALGFRVSDAREGMYQYVAFLPLP